MDNSSTNLQSGVRYEADERPPFLLAIGLGLQFALLTVGSVFLKVAIVSRAGGAGEDYLAWAVFAAAVITGTTTIIQVLRVGRVGAGYVLLMGTSGSFIAISISALLEGGPALMATLIIVASLFQFLLSARLSLLRRVLTPVVTGTVIMLIPVSITPVVFRMMGDVPEGFPESSAPVTVLATLLVTIFIALKAKSSLRLWAPVIGMVTGSIVGGYYGLYDTERVLAAPWLGLPDGHWPGIDLSFGTAFWALLPAFLFVTLVDAVDTIGDSVAIQRISWRRSRAVDYRAVQGALAADGTGNFLSGLLGTIPNTTYSSSIAVTELTGVASRMVGVVVGVIYILVAFVPKVPAVVLAIPNPVVGSFLLVLLAILFLIGMKLVVQDGIDYRKGLVVGVGFWIGVGFQNDAIYPALVADFAGGFLRNGMTSGGLAAILMTLFLELAAPRRYRMETALGTAALPKIRAFLEAFATRQGWDKGTADRLVAASEETLLTLSPRESETGQRRRLLLVVRREDDRAILELVAATGEGNLQDRIELLGDARAVETPEEMEVSLRLLRHFATSVRHQQYHDTDIITLQVDVRQPYSAASRQ
ncbi:MAG: SulP family inorganic anion transporter [Gemmatimonadetes bacterium]|nr:SulP family inorganic anion transporter [Gemmatimonadota bacterium]